MISTFPYRLRLGCMHNFVPIHTANTSYIQLVAFDIFFKAALNILEAISKQSLIITNETDQHKWC